MKIHFGKFKYFWNALVMFRSYSLHQNEFISVSLELYEWYPKIIFHLNSLAPEDLTHLINWLRHQDLQDYMYTTVYKTCIWKF